MISKELEIEILRLYHAEKWLVGTIAGELGVHHTTVRRVLVQEGTIRAVPTRPRLTDPYHIRQSANSAFSLSSLVGNFSRD